MRSQITAAIERDGEWYVAYCPEIAGANGQGRTIDECRSSLADAIALILEDRRAADLRPTCAGTALYRNAQSGAVRCTGTTKTCGGFSAWLRH